MARRNKRAEIPSLLVAMVVAIGVGIILLTISEDLFTGTKDNIDTITSCEAGTLSQITTDADGKSLCSYQCELILKTEDTCPSGFKDTENKPPSTSEEQVNGTFCEKKQDTSAVTLTKGECKDPTPICCSFIPKSG